MFRFLYVQRATVNGVMQTVCIIYQIKDRDTLADLLTNVDLTDEETRGLTQWNGYTKKLGEIYLHEVTEYFKEFVLYQFRRENINYVYFAPSTGQFASRALEIYKAPQSGKVVTPLFLYLTESHRTMTAIMHPYFLPDPSSKEPSKSFSDFEKAVGSKGLEIRDEVGGGARKTLLDIARFHHNIYVISEDIPEFRGEFKP